MSLSMSSADGRLPVRAAGSRASAARCRDRHGRFRRWRGVRPAGRVKTLAVWERARSLPLTPVAVDSVQGRGQQLRCGRQVPVGAGGADVAEVGGQQDESPVDVEAAAVGVEQSGGKGVAHVVDTRSAFARSRLNSIVAQQFLEGPLDVAVLLIALGLFRLGLLRRGIPDAV
jgi:hypothetical protein